MVSHFLDPFFGFKEWEIIVTTLSLCSFLICSVVVVVVVVVVFFGRWIFRPNEHHGQMGNRGFLISVAINKVRFALVLR